MTGIYHRPIQQALRKAGFDTRTVHPFASSHYRRPLHPDAKTDDNDLEAIFHAAINGYGLASLPVSEDYQSLQSLSRHRHNLIKQQARLKVQIRRLMHQSMRGYAELWEDDKLYHRSVALPIALKFSSAEAIANRAMRMVFQIVGGRQLWRGKGVDREYLLAKLQVFHRDHGTPIEQSVRDLHEAFAWLPKSAYAEEAKPLAQLVRKKHRGAKSIGDLLVPVLARLGVGATEEVESKPSEARSSH